ncbi:MAG: type IV secretory system conjugative DNA transfer family protein [Pseudomonadota bacterium]
MLDDIRYGSAKFADSREIARAGLHVRRDGLFVGFDERGRGIYSGGQSAVLLVGGARSGKGNFIIPFLTDGAYRDTIIQLDPKGQNGAIAELQISQGRRVTAFSPRGEVTNRINPLSHLTDASPTLVPDTKLFVLNWLPFNGAENAEYFIATGQRMIEGVTLALVELHGDITLPELAEAMAVFGSDDDLALALEDAMAKSRHGIARQVALELEARRKSDTPNAGGFTGAMGEVAKSFACLSDPQLRNAVSPPFDFSFAELTAEGAPPYLVSIQEAMEFMQSSASVIRALFTCALIYKRRTLGSRPQLWLLDEVGNIGSWPLAVELATFGAGFGIRPVYVVQSTAQLDNLAKNAGAIIPNSCGTQVYLGVRDPNEAQRLSRMLGTATIGVEDFANNERARIARKAAIRSVVMEGADPFEAAAQMAAQKQMAVHEAKLARPLMRPEEILAMPGDGVLVFMPGTLEHPIAARFAPYWKRRDLAGRYLPDPFHGDGKYVSLRTFWGLRTGAVIEETPPPELEHLPQYGAGRSFRYIEGYKPEF